MSGLPVVFFDTPLPDAYRDLVEGRLEVVGPDSGLERAIALTPLRNPMVDDFTFRGPVRRSRVRPTLV